MLTLPVPASNNRLSNSTDFRCLLPAAPSWAYTKIFVSPNSALMKLFSGPSDFALGSTIRSVFDSIQEPLLRACCSFVSIHERLNRLAHESRHGFVSLSRIYAKT